MFQRAQNPICPITVNFYRALKHLTLKDIKCFPTVSLLIDYTTVLSMSIILIDMGVAMVTIILFHLETLLHLV